MIFTNLREVLGREHTFGPVVKFCVGGDIISQYRGFGSVKGPLWAQSSTHIVIPEVVELVYHLKVSTNSQNSNNSNEHELQIRSG